MTQIIRNSVIITRSIDEVFDFVVDPTTTGRWQSNLVRSELLTPGSLSTGTQVREVRRIGKAEREAVWEVTELERPVKRGYIYSQGFGPIHQRGETTFEVTDKGTLMSFTAEIEAPFPLNLLLPVLARLMRLQNDKSFAVLKQVLETGRATSINDATAHGTLR